MDRKIPLVEYLSYYATKKLYDIKNEEKVNDLIFIVADKVIKRNRLDRKIFTDIYHYYMYRQYFKGYPVELTISNSYLIVKNIIFVYSPREYCYHEKCIPKVRAYIDKWLFGVNSDNKIFINHLDREYGVHIYDYIDNYNKTFNVITIKPIIRFVKDIYIQVSDLGYNHDYGNSENIVISDNGAYRVQGEIVFSFTYLSIDNLVNNIVDRILINLLRQVFSIYHTHIYVNVERILRKLGFSIIEHTNLTDSSLFIQIPRVSTTHNEYVRTKIVEILNDLLINKLGYDIGFTVSLTKPRLSRYYNIVIQIYLRRPLSETPIGKYIDKEFTKYVKQLIDNRVYKTYTVYHGNHIIKIDSIPLEYSIEIPSELNPLKEIFPENDIVLSTSIRNDSRFYVLPGFKATIYHDSHGLTNIVFENPGVLDIGNTRVSLRYPEFQNIVAFRVLANSYNNKENYNENNKKITEYIGVE